MVVAPVLHIVTIMSVQLTLYSEIIHNFAVLFVSDASGVVDTDPPDV